MRVALLSDVHGNLVALEAVLSELAEEAIDEIVFLGDIALFGPQPREALRRVRDLDCQVVLGNTDAWALDPVVPAGGDEDRRRLYAVELWSAEQLTAEDHGFIRTFSPTLTLRFDQGPSLLCYHGSPRSFDDAIRSTTPDEELRHLLAGHRAALMAGGHTHTQMVRRFEDRVILNPGSVGLPSEDLPGSGLPGSGLPGSGLPGSRGRRRPPWAEYAIVSWRGPASRGPASRDQRLGIELRRTPFDVDAVLAAAYDSGMPHVDWWVGAWSPEPDLPGTP